MTAQAESRLGLPTAEAPRPLSLALIRVRGFVAPFLALFILLLLPLLLAWGVEQAPSDGGARPPPALLAKHTAPRLTVRPDHTRFPPARSGAGHSLYPSTDSAHLPVAILATWVHQTLTPRHRSLLTLLPLRERVARLPTLPLSPSALLPLRPPRMGEGFRRPDLLLLSHARTFPGERTPTADDEEPMSLSLLPANSS